MKVISPIFGSMSGKLGGAVASTARGGIQYMRKLVIPSNPNTQFQTAVRNIMTGLAGAWRSTLTDPQRAAWENLALSTSGTLAGEPLYVGNNTVLLLGGGTRQDVAPVSAACILSPFTTLPVAEVSGNDVTITLPNVTDPWAATLGGVLNVYVTRVQNSSRLARQFSYQKAHSVLRGAGAPTTPFSFAYPTGFGLLVLGDIIYVRINSAAVDGRVSGSQEFRTLIVAG